MAGSAFSSIEYSLDIFLKIIPIFFLVFILMTITNYYFTFEVVSKHMGKSSGIRRWIIAVASGILSMGPIYMWYPLLNDLQKKNIPNSFLATFLYNRAIKLPLLPVLIYYFGFAYTVVLTFVMIFTSVIDGVLVEKILEVIE